MLNERIANLLDICHHNIQQSLRYTRFFENLADQRSARNRRILMRLQHDAVAGPNAGATDFMDKKKGKLNGLITPTTPAGIRYSRFSLPSSVEGKIFPSILRGT